MRNRIAQPARGLFWVGNNYSSSSAKGVTEPPGGAHRDPAAAIASTGEAIANALEELAGLDRETVRRQRREKFLAIGRTWG